MYTKIIKNKPLVYSLTITMLLAMNLVYISAVEASAITSMKDTVTNMNISETADHTVVFTLPTGIDFDVTGNTDVLRVDFPHSSAFTQSGTWATSDFTFNDGTARTINAVAQGAGTIDCTVAAGVNNVCVAIDTTNHIFTIKPSSTYTASATGATITFFIAGTAGGGTLTNPSSAASYTVQDAMCDETASCTTSFTASHSGQFAEYAITNDQVVVSATVDPSITFTLSSNSVNLGTLSTGSVATQSFTAQTVTNAVGGFSTTVQYNNALRIDASHAITDTTGTLSAGTEGYGIATTDSSQTVVTDATCGSAPYNTTALTASPQTIAGATSGPVNETNTICLAAAISSTTTAGSYTHTLTFISTGTF